MSSPTALPSPESAGQQAGADRAAGRARRGRSRRPARAASRGGGDAAGGLHHQRLGQPALGGRRGEPLEVAAEQRGEVGVDDRGRAALVLAELRQHLVRGGDVDVRGAPRAAGRRSRARGPGRGRRTAGRPPPTRRRAPRSAPTSRSSSLVARAARRPPRGRSRSRAPKRSSRATSGRGLRRAQPVQVGAVLASDVEQVGEPLGRDQRGAGARAPRAARWCPRSSRGRRPRPRALRAGALQRRLDRRDHAARLVVGRASAPWPCGAPGRRTGPRP